MLHMSRYCLHAESSKGRICLSKCGILVTRSVFHVVIRVKFDKDFFFIFPGQPSLGSARSFYNDMHAHSSTCQRK